MAFFGLFGGKKKPRFEAVTHVTEQVAANTGMIAGELLSVSVKVADDIPRYLPTEQDTWWFLAEQYDRTVDLGGFHLQLLETSSLRMHEIEYEGRRSENSYVGKKNPGIAFLDEARRGLEANLPKNFVDMIMSQGFILFSEQNMAGLNALRIKYATHFHNNCVRDGAYNNAERWQNVIDDIENR